jgi:hypothetical protein
MTPPGTAGASQSYTKSRVQPKDATSIRRRRAPLRVTIKACGAPNSKRVSRCLIEEMDLVSEVVYPEHRQTVTRSL